MENALLVGLSAQIALRRSMDVVANNVANISTGGFKRENPLFESVLASVDSENRVGGQSEVAFVRDYGLMRDLNAGPMEQTGGPLDMAIDGSAYFTVQTANGDRFTRDGHFKMDQTGRLVTMTGDPVMGEGGPIALPTTARDIKIAKDGTVSTESGQVGKIRLAAFANERALRTEGDNLFASDEPALAAPSARLQQGMLERSNVQGVSEMTKMIEIMRAYQSVSETLSQTEDTYKRAAQKLGEVKA